MTLETVNFILKNNPNSLTMTFKYHKNADDLYRRARNSLGKIEAEDDFGVHLAIDLAEVAAITMSEYETDMDKNMEFQLIGHKAQLKVQAKAKSDVGLQMLEQNANGLLKVN